MNDHLCTLFNIHVLCSERNKLGTRTAAVLAAAAAAAAAVAAVVTAAAGHM